MKIIEERINSKKQCETIGVRSRQTQVSTYWKQIQMCANNSPQWSFKYLYKYNQRALNVRLHSSFKTEHRRYRLRKKYKYKICDRFFIFLSNLFWWCKYENSHFYLFFWLSKEMLIYIYIYIYVYKNIKRSKPCFVLN